MAIQEGSVSEILVKTLLQKKKKNKKLSESILPDHQVYLNRISVYLYFTRVFILLPISLHKYL